MVSINIFIHVKMDKCIYTHWLLPWCGRNQSASEPCYKKNKGGLLSVTNAENLNQKKTVNTVISYNGYIKI